MRQQVQPQVGVIGVDGFVAQRRDHGAHRHGLDAAVVVASGELRQFGRHLGHRQPRGAGGTLGTKFGGGEPCVEDRSVGGDGRQADACSRSHVGRGYVPGASWGYPPRERGNVKVPRNARNWAGLRLLGG
jgi:hypothetical protein